MVICEDGVYKVEPMDGRVECPRCHAVIDGEDFESYELIDVDGSCCGDIFSVTIRCVKCGAMIEVL
jgi:predicted PP-loop superfamily ATPase